MLRNYLPYFIYKRLFGDRKQFGNKKVETDSEWVEWTKTMWTFYENTQKTTGKTVNDYGFQIIKNIDFNNKTVCELGPGYIDHLKYFEGIPHKYILVDTQQICLDISSQRIRNHFGNKVQIECIKADGDSIALEKESIDIVLSFHQLEHIYAIEKYIVNIRSILREGGLLAGSIPTEGGLAWGLGRYFTSRRYVRKNFGYNYDKIICWEHCHFADEIEKKLSKSLSKIKTIKKPFNFLPNDFNLSFSFIYKK